jgi:hypothetical protein
MSFVDPLYNDPIDDPRKNPYLSPASINVDVESTVSFRGFPNTLLLFSGAGRVRDDARTLIEAEVGSVPGQRKGHGISTRYQMLCARSCCSSGTSLRGRRALSCFLVGLIGGRAPNEFFIPLQFCLHLVVG